MLASRHNHPALDAGALTCQPLDQRPKIGVEEHVAVFSMIDDVDDLLGEQSRVDGMAHKARARRAVIRLHMAVVVPGQRGDAIALRESPALHGVGQLAGTSETLAIRVAVARVVPGNRDDFLVAMHALGVSHNRRDREWHIHHQTIHGGISPSQPSGECNDLRWGSATRFKGGSPKALRPRAASGRYHPRQF